MASLSRQPLTRFVVDSLSRRHFDYCITSHKMSTKNIKIVVGSNYLPKSALDIIKDYNVVITKFDGRVKDEIPKMTKEVEELMPGATALLWSSFAPLSEQAIVNAGPQFKMVANLNAGCDMIPINLLKEHNVILTNTPTVLNAAVADIAVSLVLGASRRFTEQLQQVKTGQWDTRFMSYLGQDLRDSTVGIVGLGGIGQSIVKRLTGFEVKRFIYTGRTEKPEAKSINCEYVDLETLLKESDFVILACPLTEQTKNIINENTLNKMKKNAVLVNIGRGGLVDQEDLYKALTSGQIWSAGLDVTTPEPLPADHPLLSLPNIFVLPHIGSKTIRTRTEMAELAAKNILNFLTGKPLLTEVPL